ncbi:MAG: alpha/beta hydrolase [Bacteroidia bacterium]|nr:alpha/beta hydrolase [Bacteroidia bacterium]
MNAFFQYDSGKIHFTDQGIGATIVLIHGYLETAEIWTSFANRLSENFRVITVDLPGHGKSSIYGEVSTMDFMATVVAKLLEYLNIKRAFITGHSLGGYITLAFTDLYPEMLTGYCLFHSHPFADTPETIEKREMETGLVREGKKDQFYPGNVTKMYAPNTLKRFHEALLRSKEIASGISGEAIIAVLKGMMARPSRVSVMEAGRVPCLWILGTMDNYVNYESVLSEVHLPQNAKVVMLKNSGHLGFIEEEDLTMKVITDFVNNLIIK